VIEELKQRYGFEGDIDFEVDEKAGLVRIFQIPRNEGE
jgi:hypothetical protein